MTIVEAAEKMNISVDTLRYYERIGILPPVPRRSNGMRVYDTSYLEWITLIRNLKAGGMSLEAVLDYMELARQGDDTAEERKELLREAKRSLTVKIDELQLAVQQAEEELRNYEKALLPQTERLMGCMGHRSQAAG